MILSRTEEGTERYMDAQGCTGMHRDTEGQIIAQTHTHTHRVWMCVCVHSTARGK